MTSSIEDLEQHLNNNLLKYPEKTAKLKRRVQEERENATAEGLLQLHEYEKRIAEISAKTKESGFDQKRARLIEQLQDEKEKLRVEPKVPNIPQDDNLKMALEVRRRFFLHGQDF